RVLPHRGLPRAPREPRARGRGARTCALADAVGAEQRANPQLDHLADDVRGPAERERSRSRRRAGSVGISLPVCDGRTMTEPVRTSRLPGRLGNLGPRERALAIVLGIIVVLAVVLLLLSGGGGEIPEVTSTPGINPSPSATAVTTTPPETGQ